MAPQRAQRLVRISATVVTLLLSAMLTARGTTQLLAAAVLPVTADKAPSRAARPPLNEPPPLTPVQIGTAILERNMFDSQTGAMTWDAPVAVTEAETSEGGETPSADDPMGEPGPCATNLRLVATTVVPRRPELSFASISTGAEGKSMLYRQGMKVEGHEVVGIREQRVFLRPSGRPLCQATMFSPPPSAAPPPAEPPAVAAAPAGDERPPPAPKSSISEEELNAGITQVSDTNYTVSRTLLDKVLSAQSELMRAARVIPYEENGRVVGVKVYGIRRAALLGKLGIQNGDVLRTINGFDLSSPDSALEAYTKLRQMDQFTIAMIRRGQPRTMEYSVK